MSCRQSKNVTRSYPDPGKSWARATSKRTRSVAAGGDGRWSLARALASIERDLPQSVRSMIERKIDQLDYRARDLFLNAPRVRTALA